MAVRRSPRSIARVEACSLATVPPVQPWSGPSGRLTIPRTVRPWCPRSMAHITRGPDRGRPGPRARQCLPGEPVTSWTPWSAPGTVTSCLAWRGAALRNTGAAGADPYGSWSAVTSRNGQGSRDTDAATTVAGCSTGRSARRLATLGHTARQSVTGKSSVTAIGGEPASGLVIRGHRSGLPLPRSSRHASKRRTNTAGDESFLME